MRVLLDEQLPLDLSLELPGHAVDTVVSRGWAGIKNGELLGRMRGEYDVLVTMDRGIEFLFAGIAELAGVNAGGPRQGIAVMQPATVR